MLKMKSDIKRQGMKIFDYTSSNLNNFHLLQVVDLIQEGKNSILKKLSVKGLTPGNCMIMAMSVCLYDTLFSQGMVNT